MRVVVVPAQAPAREGGAAARTSLALLRGLVANGVDVTMVAPRWPGSEQVPAPAGFPVTLVDIRPPAYGGLRGAAHRLRRPVDELAGTELAAAVRDLAGGADALHLDQVETACLGPDPRTPTVLHLHYRALLDARLGLPWRPEFRHRLEFAAAERRAVRRHAFLLANSGDVATRMLQERPGADVTVAPLPLDPADYRVGPPVREPVVGVIGTATWAPTAAAIRRLVDEVWPRVRRRAPDARLRIAGRGTAALAVSDPSVEVCGEVASAAEFIGGLAVLLYAAPRGSGTKVKVLEALACGVPVVTSPPGAEGLGTTPGVVLADGADALAAACCELLDDATGRAERGRAARRYVEERHAPAPATAPLIALYERMAAG